MSVANTTTTATCARVVLDSRRSSTSSRAHVTAPSQSCRAVPASSSGRTTPTQATTAAAMPRSRHEAPTRRPTDIASAWSPRAVAAIPGPEATSASTLIPTVSQPCRMKETQVRVRDGMTTMVLSIGPAHTLREAARAMAGRKVGAAVVIDPDTSGVGILTERDVLDAIGEGLDPDREVASQHLTADLVFAHPNWTLEEAARAMVRGGFRHLVVMDDDEVVGMLSVRDIVRCWTDAPAATGTG